MSFKALNLYADMAGIDFESDLPLFRGLNIVKAKTRMRRSKISYTRVRELVKGTFADSTDVNLIGVHSLRAGGASSAANNGIPDRLFKRHGRWSSENAKDGYIRDRLEDRLSVSRNLGI